jgi:hypothetical protein
MNIYNFKRSIEVVSSGQISWNRGSSDFSIPIRNEA